MWLGALWGSKPLRRREIKKGWNSSFFCSAVKDSTGCSRPPSTPYVHVFLGQDLGEDGCWNTWGSLCLGSTHGLWWLDSPTLALSLSPLGAGSGDHSSARNPLLRSCSSWLLGFCWGFPLEVWNNLVPTPSTFSSTSQQWICFLFKVPFSWLWSPGRGKTDCA